MHWCHEETKAVINMFAGGGLLAMTQYLFASIKQVFTRNRKKRA